MKRSKILKALAVTAALPLLYLADAAPDASPGMTLIREAQAIVGAPAIGTVVSTLPAGCKPETQSSVEVQNCGGYYRSAFQGNNLVYVVQ